MPCAILSTLVASRPATRESHGSQRTQHSAGSPAQCVPVAPQRTGIKPHKTPKETRAQAAVYAAGAAGTLAAPSSPLAAASSTVAASFFTFLACPALAVNARHPKPASPRAQAHPALIFAA